MDRFGNKYRIESSRAERWDYSSTGWYFITVCVRKTEQFFGSIVGGEMRYTEIGLTAIRMYQEIPLHHSLVDVADFSVMPDHMHGLIFLYGNRMNRGHEITIDNTIREQDGIRGSDEKKGKSLNSGRDVACNVSTNISVRMSQISPHAGSLGTVVRSFKSAVTNWCHKNGHPEFGWQPRYHDRIIRSNRELENVRQYIRMNPMRYSH